MVDRRRLVAPISGQARGWPVEAAVDHSCPGMIVPAADVFQHPHRHEYVEFARDVAIVVLDERDQGRPLGLGSPSHEDLLVGRLYASTDSVMPCHVPGQRAQPKPASTTCRRPQPFAADVSIFACCALRASAGSKSRRGVHELLVKPQPIEAS